MNFCKRIYVRTSEDDLNTIRDKAAQAGLDVSAYMRQCALGEKIVVINGLRPMQAELRRIGNNVNQLVVLCHQGRITAPGLDNVKKELHKIWQSLNSLIVQSRQR